MKKLNSNIDKKLKSTLDNMYYKESPLMIEWLFLFCVCGLMLISFYYIDTKTLTAWSMNLLDAFTEGKIKDFYLMCYINEYGAHSTACYGPFYQLIPLAIWNIPIWLIEKFTNISVIDNAWTMIWSKGFWIIIEVIVLRYTYKITYFLTKDQNKSLWAVYITASFSFVLIAVFYSGQSDILVLALGTIAIYNLILRKEKWFLIWSILAVSVKPFFIFPFVIIVLFTEKHIIKILVKIAISYVPTFVFQILFADAPMFKESYELATASENMDMLTRTSFGNVLMTKGSWFFLLYIILCVIAYIKNENTMLREKYIVFFTAASNLLILGFTSIQHYRPVYIAPFLFILFMLNSEWYKVNIILKSFYSFSTIFAMSCGSENFFSRENIDSTLITKIFPIARTEYENIREVVIQYINDYEIYHKIFASVSVACIVIMIVINYPGFKLKPEIDCTNCERWVLWIDLLLTLSVVLITFKVFLNWFSFI